MTAELHDVIRPPLPPSSAQRGLRGLLWAGMGLGSQGVAQLLLLAVLARMLTPADFGVVTATLVIVSFGQLFTQGVIGAALVQRPALDDDHVRAAFWLSLGTGLLAAAMLVLAAPGTASFFSMPRLEPVMASMSVVFLLEAFTIVPLGLLERSLRFRPIALADLVSNTVGLAGVGIVAGLLGAGIWALVFAYIAQALVRATALLAVQPHRATGRLHRRAAVELVYYGGGFLGGRFFSYFAIQGDNLVLARTQSAAALGIYGRAYQLIAMPAMLFGQVLDRVLFPLVSRMQDDVVRVAELYRRALSLLIVAMVPISVILLVGAEEIVRVLLGTGWDGVVAPLRVFAVGLVARTAYKVADTVARATGHVYARARRQAVYAALVMLGAAVGQAWGVTGAAVGVTIAIFVNHVLMAALCIRVLPLSWGVFLRAHARPGAGALVLIPLATLVRAPLHAAGLAPIVVVAALAVTTLVGSAGLVGLVPWFVPEGDVRWLLGEIRSWRARR